MEYLVNGQSSSNGFWLSVDDGNRAVEMTTAGFDKSASSLNSRTEKLMVDIAIFVMIVGVAAYWILMRLPFVIGFLFSIWWVVASIFATGFVFTVLERECRKWHGCEHKLAELYMKDLPRTEVVLRRASRVQLKCGGTYVMTILIWPPAFLALGALFLRGGGLVNFLPFPPLISFLLVTAVCLFIIIFGPQLGSVLLQRYFTTAEPDEYQISAALELASRIDAALAE